MDGRAIQVSTESIIVNKVKAAQQSTRALARSSADVRDTALRGMADRVLEQKENLKLANEKDLIAGREKGLSSAFMDRLELTDARIEGMADGLRQISALPDPIGEVIHMWRRPNGLQIGKVRVPIGVIGIIYESRPNVTADAAGLCLKAANAVVLRGGSDALNSNLAITTLLQEAAVEAGLPEGCIQYIDVPGHDAVNILLRQDQYVDVIIPRGGKTLIRSVMENSTIPVVKHEDGICHTYVDAHADLAMADDICFNAKVQRPGVCNAMETLLVHEGIAETFLHKACVRLKKAGVKLKGCEKVRELFPDMTLATEEDWTTEYLDLTLSIRIVDSLDEAIDHIETYGSHHSDAIVTDNYTNSQKFLNEVDSAAVYVNASTRFTDGYEFGLGAEIGISTQKLHSRGPMGIEDLTSIKYVIYGEGQIRP